MDNVQVMLFLLLLCSQSRVITSCDLRYTKQPIYGYRAIASSNTDEIVLQIDQPQCVWKCLSMNSCRYISHNSGTGQCVLGLGKCESLAAVVGGTIYAFGPLRDSCLQWSSTHDPDRIQFEIPGVRRLARILTGETMLVGKFDISTEIFWANNEGVQVGPIYQTDQDIEFLTADPACTLPWMPYTAGELLPAEAISGGYLPDRSVTYVSRVSYSGSPIFGYYNAGSEFAYYEMYGVRTATSMELLILL